VDSASTSWCFLFAVVRLHFPQEARIRIGVSISCGRPKTSLPLMFDRLICPPSCRSRQAVHPSPCHPGPSAPDVFFFSLFHPQTWISHIVDAPRCPRFAPHSSIEQTPTPTSPSPTFEMFPLRSDRHCFFPTLPFTPRLFGTWALLRS